MPEPSPTWRAAIALMREALALLEADMGGETAAPLTDRERQVLTHIGAGLTNGQIAERLGISVSTVKTHVAAVLEKLGAATRAAAAAMIAELDE